MTIDDNFMPETNSMLNLFVDWYNAKMAGYDIPRLTREEAYIVWFCYTVGNAKALISTTRKDHMYYEVTYNNLKGEAYVDQYVKIAHTTFTKEKEIKEKQILMSESTVWDDAELPRYPKFDEESGQYRFSNTDKHASFLSGDTQD